ncbi:Phosphoinositide phosphatase SAC3 [Cardamine amara subsp. amara]|uniref:Phosphoinositide phosphatase SAC3 n=1 Tax=Cardamine amara subsp. amara TaxID=228776 RepID=A0ABD0ZEI9_CARAN
MPNVPIRLVSNTLDPKLCDENLSSVFYPYSRKTTNVLVLLGKVADYALMLTDLFYRQVTPAMKFEGYMSLSSSDADTVEISPHTSFDDDNGDHYSVKKKSSKSLEMFQP